MSDGQFRTSVDVTRRKLLGTIGAAGTASLTGCLSGSGSSTSIKIAGSSTVFPVTKRMTELYRKEKDDSVQFSVKSNGTGAGFSNFFCAGKSAINDASRPISKSERKKCKKNGVEPVEFQIATDALTVIANTKNDWVDCLSFDQLAEIWGPKDPAQKWSDVNSNWPDEDMSLHGPTSSSGTFDFFTETVMGEEGKHRTDYQGTEQDNAIVTAVEGNEYAMGYLGFSYYVENKDQLKGIAVKKSSGGSCVKPSFETASAGDYPLSRPLFIYVDGSALQKKAVREFVRFYVQKSKTDAIKEIGYVPVPDSVIQENLNKLEKFSG